MNAHRARSALGLGLFALALTWSTGCVIERRPVNARLDSAMADAEGDAFAGGDTAEDASRDARRFDAPSLDVPLDTRLADAGADVPGDGGGDATSVDAGMDAPPDDAGIDAPSFVDGGMDAPVFADAGVDTSDLDVGVDADLEDVGVDAVPDFDANTCLSGTSRCVGANRVECMGAMEVTTFCELGCQALSDTEARCNRLSPTHVPARLLDLEGLIVLTARDGGTLRLDTGNGRIQRVPQFGPTFDVRPSGTGLRNGIHFEVIAQPGGPSIGVLSVAGLVVESGATLTAVGSPALAILATGAIDVEGLIDVGANVAMGGPGGYNRESGPGRGDDANRSGSPDPGAGGAGFGGQGGQGDDDEGREGGAGGLPYGDVLLSVLEGGSGGGSSDGGGGGGGGAIQLTSAVSIRIRGVISSPGAGGRAGNQGGGGGGSGGAVFLEAPSIEGAGIVAVNGGGGGGGFRLSGSDGERGRDDGVRASGGEAGIGSDGRGGDGAAGDFADGDNGAGDPASGGGGGGGGRIRVLVSSSAARADFAASPAPVRSDGTISLR